MVCVLLKSLIYFQGMVFISRQYNRRSSGLYTFSDIIYNLLIPVFGTLLSGLLLRENVFTAVNIASIFLVCGGIAAVNKQ